MADNAFVKATRDFRSQLTKDIDVSNLLLGELLARRVLTQEQYDQIRVRCFTVFSV